MNQSADSHRFLPLLFVGIFLFSGCVGGRTTVDPYKSSTTVAGSGQQPGSVSAQAAHARDVVMPAMKRINLRISSYESREQSWKNISTRVAFFHLSPEHEGMVFSCRKQAMNVLDGYRQVQGQLSGTQSMNGARQLLNHVLPETQQADFAYIEGECPQLLKSLRDKAADTGMESQSLQDSMVAALDAGDYDTVIRVYQSLPLSPGSFPEYNLSYSYGIALAKSGRMGEAIRELGQLYFRTAETSPEISQVQLLQLLADLNFGVNDFAAARNHYEELIRLPDVSPAADSWARHQLAALGYANIKPDEVRLYASLLSGLVTYNPSRDGFTLVQQAQAFLQQYPGSLLESNVQEMEIRAGQDAEQWFAGVLKKVDQLSEEQNIQEAMSLLEKIPPDILPLDKQAILKLKKNSLGSGGPAWNPVGEGIEEEVLKTTVPAAGVAGTTSAPNSGVPMQENAENAREGAHLPVSALQETWDKAVAQMQAREYDASIALFSELLNTSYGVEAKGQIEQASSLAAQEDRKRAAELFVRSNRATDPAARKKLLLSSRALLEDILRKYPHSGLGDKVRRNLSRLDRELASME